MMIDFMYCLKRFPHISTLHVDGVSSDADAHTYASEHTCTHTVILHYLGKPSELS